LFSDWVRDVRHVRSNWGWRVCGTACGGWGSSGSADRPEGWATVVDERVAGRDRAPGGGSVPVRARRLGHSADLRLCVGRSPAWLGTRVPDLRPGGTAGSRAVYGPPPPRDSGYGHETQMFIASRINQPPQQWQQPAPPREPSPTGLRQGGQWSPGPGWSDTPVAAPATGWNYVDSIRTSELVPTRKIPPGRGWRCGVYKGTFGLINLGFGARSSVPGAARPASACRHPPGDAIGISSNPPPASRTWT
jgi:hypothetical protein